MDRLASTRVIFSGAASSCRPAIDLAARLRLALLCAIWLLPDLAVFDGTPARAEEPQPGQVFLEFIRTQAAAMRAQNSVPKTREEWEQLRTQIRAELQQAWGPFPNPACDLSSRKLGELQRDGYRVEKWIFQTRPDVWMTANCYVPDKPGKHPAILAVHGHWKGAKQDPVPQARCIGPAKLGYVVLAVDAFGAGERGLGKALGEYHGEMVAATLFPVGLPLSGLQVYENMRAVDFLQARDDVDASRIGITGASGGGNQSMYAGAWDDRFAGVVPVCSVGTYDAYLGAACCMCEVVPGALRFTEEWGILGLTAPRGLMVVNASKDAFQFSIGEAAKSLAATRRIYELYQRPEAVRHTTFEWHHDYSQAMREAMYGWMNRHLRDGSSDEPIPDPPMKTEDPETLRCFPGDSRPDDWMTIPKFAAREARQILASRNFSASDTERQRAQRRSALARLLGNPPGTTPLRSASQPAPNGAARAWDFSAEPGIRLSAVERSATTERQKNATESKAATAARTAIVVDCEGAEKARQHPVVEKLTMAGWSVVTFDLRATGPWAWKADSIGRAPDHNSAEWSLWIGRPLAGQWALDIRRLIDSLVESDAGAAREIAVVGIGPAGVAALCASALDARIHRLITVDSLASYVTDQPFQGQRLGIMIPRILPEVGDIAHLAALSQAQRIVIAGGVWGNGTALNAEELRSTYQPALDVTARTRQDLQLIASDRVGDQLGK
jgi:dienelactone hydrolase